MHFPKKYARHALKIILVILVIGAVLPLVAVADEVPRAALRYQRDLIRNARFVWGVDAPVAVLAAQVHQESRWNPNAHSTYASGLAQFTPDTARWISGAYPSALGVNAPLNPAWALRALAQYDYLLYARANGDDACNKMWKTLWAYNGGEGWVQRDEAKAKKHGANPRNAWAVEPFNAGRAAQFFAENRAYPRAILLKWQPLYVSWGGEIKC